MSERKSNLDRAIANLQCYRFSGCTEVKRFNEAIECLRAHVKEKRQVARNEI